MTFWEWTFSIVGALVLVGGIACFGVIIVASIYDERYWK